MGKERAEMVFTDPPWNIAIEDNVSGLGMVKHKDFAMACGEMTPTEFEAFLRSPLVHAAAHSKDGALHYICMHWSKMKEMLAAAEDVYDKLLNLCVWNKTNAGMGSLYRSKHELVFVFKTGKGPHINNVALGRFGRHRSNVWDYPGQNIFNGTDKSKLKLHPTAKSVALVADAIRDASHRGGVILDPFGGAGSTLIAAERTDRRARLIELEPRYVDAAIKRWEALTVIAPKRSRRFRHRLSMGARQLTSRSDRLWTTTQSAAKAVQSSPRTRARVMTDASDPDDKVGYKRPPQRTRFQPGVSGNPRGRQKGVRNFATDLKRTLEIPVTLSENGKSKRGSTQEALMLRLRDKALKGDARALDMFIALAKTHNVDLGAPSEERPVAQEDQAILEAFLEEGSARCGSPAGSTAACDVDRRRDGKDRR